MIEAKRIGDILVDLQVLSPAEVDRVLVAMRRRNDNVRFGQVARSMNLLRDEHILAALAVQMELFPQVHNMGLGRILDTLKQPVAAPPARNVKASRRRISLG